MGKGTVPKEKVGGSWEKFLEADLWLPQAQYHNLCPEVFFCFLMTEKCCFSRQPNPSPLLPFQTELLFPNHLLHSLHPLQGSISYIQAFAKLPAMSPKPSPSLPWCCWAPLSTLAGLQGLTRLTNFLNYAVRFCKTMDKTGVYPMRSCSFSYIHAVLKNFQNLFYHKRNCPSIRNVCDIKIKQKKKKTL